MKLDSISCISEIAKYYGTLDDVFRLLNRLNTRTRKIWENNSVKIFKDIQRRSINICSEAKNILFTILQKYLYVPTLFQINRLDISTEASLEMLVELFENLDNPQMIKMNFALSLWENRDTNLTLLNYTKYIEYTDFSYLELYNKIIETAIRRQIHLDFIRWFLFIQEISKLKEIKFIHSILFPWNKDYEAESMISLWEEFLDSSQLYYREVILIWDDMKLSEFIKIYTVLSETKTNLKIHVSKKNPELYQFFDQISLNQQIFVSFKIWEMNISILWDTSSNVNEINLRNWYYQTLSHSVKTFRITNWCIYYKDSIEYNWAPKLLIYSKRVKSIRFNYYPIVYENLKWTDLNSKIHFNKYIVLFDVKLLKDACFRKLEFNQMHFINKKIVMNKKYLAEVKYFQWENLTNLKITNIPLNIEDIKNLIKSIIVFGNIKILSLYIEDPSWIIIILDWWNLINPIISISLKVAWSINLSQKSELKLKINKLKCQNVRVNIVAPNLTLKNY